MPKRERFLKRTSDRSGFDTVGPTLVKDGSYKVLPDEYDEPPLSRRSLGGEGDIAQGEQRSGSDFATGVSTTDTSSANDNPTVYITAAIGITPNFVHPYMKITGSNAAIDITADPQIAAGKQNQVLTLWCVDSGITLDNANGIALIGSSRFVMDSGSIITLFYTTDGSVWQETSRTRRF